MSDLFELGEEGAEAIGGWARAGAAALAACVGLWTVLDVSDSLSSSTPGFVLSQWARHAAGRAEEGELEARALLAHAAAESGLRALGSVRVWASDKLSDSEADGRFNPVVYKITLGERFARRADYDQRWLVFHEAGHAAQLLTTRFEPMALPSWGLSRGAAEAMAGSLLYRRAYSESFADVFALSMAVRLDPRDPRAMSELASARRAEVDSVSISHDTQAALRLAGSILPQLRAERGPALLALVDAIASKGAARTVGEWGAEREALCLEGLWGWERWALDGAHEVSSNPWTMARPRAPQAGEAWAAELGELMALTEGPMWGSKRAAALRGARGAYLSRLEGRAEAGSTAPAREAAWGSALADYEKSSRSRARGLLALPLRWAALAAERERPQGCEATDRGAGAIEEGGPGAL